ncbi:MAG TPA: AAA family ATPase [Pseudonocardiaceae bacterium]|nr:AAA family ATPase [Pseudonocardiaceae bacterium]
MPAVVVSGPQCSGKTTLAMALGSSLAVPVFSRDPLLAVLTRYGLSGRDLATAGLDLQTALLARQLELGQSCVLECVLPNTTREQWRRMIAAAGSRMIAVECVCSDPEEHRARFERRSEARGFGWDYVLRTMRHYRPDEHPDYTADALRPVAEHVAAITQLVSS